MRKKRLKIFAFCIILFSLWGSVTRAVTCYDCNSQSDGHCHEISKSSTKKMSGCKHCLKVHQKLLGISEDIVITHRECTWATEDMGCDKRELRNSLRSDVCRCKTNLCNAAPVTTRANWVTLGQLVTLSLLVVARANY